MLQLLPPFGGICMQGEDETASNKEIAMTRYIRANLILPPLCKMTLLVVYGVTAKAAGTAYQHLRDMGEKVSLLILKTLYPVAEKRILQSFDGKNRVIVIEMNLGQYVREIERLAGVLPVLFHGKMNGELISPKEIAERVTQ